VKSKWRYPPPHGGRATTRCVNSSRYFPEHLISDDGTRCLACGAVRVVAAAPEPAPPGAVRGGEEDT
jgi:hypothetical protein